MSTDLWLFHDLR